MLSQIFTKKETLKLKKIRGSKIPRLFQKDRGKKLFNQYLLLVLGLLISIPNLFSQNTNTWSGANPAMSTAGVTTITITATTPAGTDFTATPTDMMGTQNAYSVSTIPGDNSFDFILYWDTSPDTFPTGDPFLPLASDDGGTGTFTITYSNPVSNPVIHIDRVGGHMGDSDYDPNNYSNSSKWTLTTPGLSLMKLSGVDHLEVTSTTFQRTPTVNMGTAVANGAECASNTTDGTACGTIQVLGTNITSITFDWEGVGVEGSGADGIEMIFDAPLDNDGDGILNVDDIDDDNDGITDTQELCGTDPVLTATSPINISINLDQYPTETSWTLSGPSGQVASGGPYSSGNTTVTASYDATENGSYTFFIFDSFGDGIQGNTYAVSGSDFATITTAFSGASQSETFTINSAVSNPFDCLSADPTADSDGDGTLNYQDPDYCTLNGNGVCNTMDTDGDGTIDIFDLDSDGDGCYDAEEAGHGQAILAGNTIANVAADVGTNGLDNDVESGDVNNASLSYTITETNGGTFDFQDAALDDGCAGSTLTDNDGDGISNILDIDDDNDGITDTQELCGTYPISSSLSTITVSINLDQYPAETSWTLSGPSGQVASGGSYTVGNTTESIDVDVTESGSYTFFILDSFGDGMLGNTYTLSGADFTDITTAFTTGSSQSENFTLTVPTGGNTFSCLSADPAADSDNDGTPNYQDSDYCSLNANGVCADMDTDGDGIIDIFDLDSDNDGCLDAEEAGHGEMVQADSTIITTPADVGDNGLDDSVELDDTGTASLNYSIGETNSGTYDFQSSSVTAACTPPVDTDGDGIADIDDLDDDNDGIPDLNESTPCGASAIYGGFVGKLYDGVSLQDSWGILSASSSFTTSGFTQIATFDYNEYANSSNGLSVEFAENPYDMPTSMDGDVSNYSGSTIPNDGLNNDAMVEFYRTIKSEEAGRYDFKLDYGDDHIFIYVNGVKQFEAQNAYGSYPNDEVYTTILSSITLNTGDLLQLIIVEEYLFNTEIQIQLEKVANVDGSTPAMCPSDTDGDGIANHLDLDSDNDGIPDIVEAGGIDTNGDGQIDYPTPTDPMSMVDLDGDGLADTYDDTDTAGGTSGWVAGTPITNPDSDMDGLVDALDLDADNDGIPDLVELGGVDSNGDGLVDTTTDADGDGFADVYDPDTDGTPGIDTGAESKPLVETDDSGNPLNGETGVSLDRDGDGLADNIDLDADNDGIPDLVEAGGVDTNGDGLVDTTTDADNDGFADIYDTDDDGTPGVEDTTDALLQTAGTDTDADGKADDAAIVFQNGEAINADTDGDGLPDHLDLDADNDGIPDLVEAGGVDTNGDGLVDTTTDADNDGFADVYDTDDDGTPGVEDATDALLQTAGTDTDADGKADDAAIVFQNGEAVNADSDGDGLPDHLDLDADNDGIPDLVEAGGVDTNGDGLVDTTTDADNDGLADIYDTDDDGTPGVEDTTDALLQTAGTDTDADGKADDAAIVFQNGEAVNADSDGDGLPDHLDLDADNDGIPDLVEAGGVDTNGDGLVDTTTDADNDGLADIYDTDDDGTAGVEDVNDALLQTAGTDTDADGKADDAAIVFQNGEAVNADSDGDGLPDHLDLDADNDGIPDLVEAGGVDTNGDGLVDTTTDADNDGLADIYDTDDDGTPGVEDATDALLQTAGTDTDADGKADDAAIVFQNGEAVNADSDGDGLPDHLDLDADNDGIPDLVEAGGVDTNGDGLVDTTTDADNDGLADIYDTDDDGTPGVEDTTDALLQTAGTDTDADGKADDAAIIFQNGEAVNADSDGDGLPDHLDLDADNDGIPDLVEAGGVDTNGDGLVDTTTDADNDGFADIYDTDDDGTPGVEDATDALLQTAGTDTDADGKADDAAIIFQNGEAVNADSDGDGLPDHLDLDADNDGIPDLVEAGGVDTNGDGLVDTTTDADNDGLADIYDTDDDGTPGVEDTTDALLQTAGTDTDADGKADDAAIVFQNGEAVNADSDGDGLPDHLDLDADNDGIPDLVEAGGVDTNGDGLVDNTTDADNDGLADVYDTDDDGTPGVEDATDAIIQTSGSDTDGDGKADDAAITFVNGEGIGVDSDGDGLPDHLDLDADNDGIPDLIEAGGVDTNGDGLVDITTDADNDGFADVYDTDDDGTAGVEDTTDALMQTGGTDTDADGKADDFAITFIDGNGGSADKDQDGHPDHLDLDADNDGIPDIVELGGIDTDGDGRVDAAYAADVDNDGFADTYDADDNTTPATDDGGIPLVETDGSAVLLDGMDASPMDSDGDGLADHLDLDADNDGVPDLIEAGGIDPEGDGYVDLAALPWDADGDGLADVYDSNADDGPEGTGTNGVALVITSADIGSDGHVSVVGETMVSGGGGSNNTDADADGVPNHLDIDADNDGMMDVTETGATDSNNDGRIDDGAGAFIDTDNDGLADAVDGDVGNDYIYESSNPLITANPDSGADTDTRAEYAGNGIADSDADDVPDYLDVDSDNDGIYDNYEAQSTAGYVSPGTTDTDGDGLLDAYDTDSGAAQNGLTPYNHDLASGDMIPDYLDLDADGDNIPDAQEAWDNIADGDSQCDNVPACTNEDSDGDGLIDCFDSNDADPNTYSWEGDPADDTDGSNGTIAGTVFTDNLDVLLPDNGYNMAEPDYRDNINACATAQVYYAVTEQGVESTEYEFNGALHTDGANTSIIRATTYCEPDVDGWYYYYNPLEPGNYLFAVKYNNAPVPVVPMWDIIDYIELKVDPDATSRHKVGATEATFVMERDWNVVFKGTPTTGSTFDIKFYFKPEEMEAMDTAADVVEAAATGTVTREFFWFKKAGGLSNSDIAIDGVTDMQDITSNDPDGINEVNSGIIDGTVATTGNSRNFVTFEGLTSFSGGTAGIKISYSALPVTLATFEGRANGCNVNLTWTSSDEDNFSHYELESSRDGQRFEHLNIIEGIGGNYITAYGYTDESPGTLNYYRLKMVDFDGSFEYSEVITVSTDCDDYTKEELIVYPNPIGNKDSELRVKFYTQKTENVYLLITDITQRSVKEIPLEVENGWNTIIVNVIDLEEGMYNLTLINNGNIIAQPVKLVKVDDRH